MAKITIDVKDYVRPLLAGMLPMCTESERESVVELIDEIADHLVGVPQFQQKKSPLLKSLLDYYDLTEKKDTGGFEDLLHGRLDDNGEEKIRSK